MFQVYRVPVIVVFPAFNLDFSFFQPRLNKRIHGLKYRIEPVKETQTSSGSRRWLESEKYSVVHTETGPNEAGWLLFWKVALCRERKTRPVWRGNLYADKRESEGCVCVGGGGQRERERERESERERERGRERDQSNVETHSHTQSFSLCLTHTQILSLSLPSLSKMI